MNTEDILKSMNNYFDDFFSNINKETIKEEPKEDLDVEHIRFSKKDILMMLQISSTIINPKSTQVVPKSITIKLDTDGYKMIVNNDLEYLEYSFNILNKENKLRDTISLPIELIKSIIGMIGEDIIIYKKDNSYYIRLLLEGDLYLDLPKPEDILVKRPISEIEPINFKVEAGEDSNIVSSSHLLEALKSITPLVEEEPILDRKRIVFLDDRMYFHSMKYFIEYNLPLPKMKISLRFAEVIKKIISVYNIDGGVKFYKDSINSNRVIIKYKDILFTSTVTNVIEEKKLIEYLDRVKDYKQIIVKVKDIENIVNIAYALPYSKREVKIEYKDELIISIPVKNKITEFKVPSKLIGNNKVNNSITVPAKNLKKLIDSFNYCEDITISILDKSIIINKDNLIGVLVN